MKNKFLISLLLLFPILVQCQIVYSEVYAKAKRPQTYDRQTVKRAYVQRGNELMILKQADKTFFFQKFDLTTLKLIKSTTPPFSTENAKDFEAINIGGKDYLIFDMEVDRAWKTVMQEIDFENCGLKGKPLDIPAGLALSSDSSKVLITSFTRGDNPNDSKNFYTTSMTIFDNDLSEIWKHKIQFPYAESKINSFNNAIDNQGNVYILLEVYKDEEKKNIPIFFKISEGGKTVEIPILTKYELKNTRIVTGKDGNIICMGSYGSGEEDKYGRFVTEGFFSCSIKEEKVVDFKYTNFVEPIAKLNLNDKDPGYLPRINLDRVYPNLNGGALLLFEYWAKGSKAFIHYVLIKINAQNEIEWCKGYPKWENDDVGFYDDPYELGELFRNSFERHNKLYILDTKHRKMDGNNYLSFDSRVPGISYIRMYEIDPATGSHKAHFFKLDKDLKGYHFLPSYFYMIDESAIIFEGYSKKDELLVKIPIK